MHYENMLTFRIRISDQKCEISMDFLQIFDGHESYYLYIRDFDRFIFNNTKSKNKKKKKNNLSQVRRVRFVKTSLKMTMIKLEIITT